MSARLYSKSKQTFKKVCDAKVNLPTVMTWYKRMFWWNDVLLLGQTTDCAKRSNIWQIQEVFFFFFFAICLNRLSHTHRYPTLLSVSSQVSFLWALSQSYSHKVSQHESKDCIMYQVSLCDHRLGVLTKADTEGLLWNHFTKREKLLNLFRHCNLMGSSNITIKEICKCYVVHHVAYMFYFVYCILYQPLDILVLWNGLDIVFSWYQGLNYSDVTQLKLSSPPNLTLANSEHLLPQ